MNGIVFQFSRYHISALDVAVLSDTGVPTRSPPHSDFDGDGKSTFSGRTTTAGRDLADGWNNRAEQRTVGSNPGASWHVKGAGDFNGDGKADILLQNVSGQPMIWLMNGTTLISSVALSNPGASWHVKGAGDVNGDGKADILWQNDSGQAGVWLMDGTTMLSVPWSGLIPALRGT